MKKRRNMSLNNDVSQKQKLTEQFRTIWIPRQRTKETACELNNPIQVKKTFDWHFAEGESVCSFWGKQFGVWHDKTSKA